jgi:acetolactate synthase I/II/III large subunit
MADAEQPSAVEHPSAAERFLAALTANGVRFFFGNAGTDFPPIIEAFAKAAETGDPVPRPITVPHENTAVSMAHGVAMVTGEPQAVMVHVNVGTANSLNTLINASREGVPMLLLAGRSPITEGGMHGSRSRYIHWAQEMFDQAGMVREVVKWDYELRAPGQVDDVVARAVEVATASPTGPVYLTLPREPLAAKVPSVAVGPARRAPPVAPYPDPDAIARLADWIAAAERPLIISSGVGRRPDETAALAALADRFALAVVPFNPRYLVLPSDHPMHQGGLPGPLLREADLVLVIDTDVPWIPAQEAPPADCRVVHVGPDPAFLRYPIRSYPADLSVTTATGPFLAALAAALAARLDPASAVVRARHARLARRAADRRTAARALTEKQAGEAVIRPEYLSRCIADALGPDALIVNEYPLRLDHADRTVPGSYFGLSPAGGLGWGLGAALGAKLAAPDRLVAATLGDGAYLFANPPACHWTSAACALPILTVVFDNRLYGAVRNSTLAMYGQGAAARGDGRLLADLGPAPDHALYARASGGWGLRVERPADLPGALAEAKRVVTEERRQALLDVVCDY